MLKNFKLRYKLTIIFVLLSVMVVITGLFGIISINNLNNNDKILYQNQTVPLSYLINIASNSQKLRVEIRNIAMTTDDNLKKEYADNIDRILKDDEDLLSKYGKLSNSEQIKRLFAEYKVVKDNVVSLINKLEELSITNKKQDFLNGLRSGAQIVKDEKDGLDKLIKAQIDEAKRISDENSASSRSAMIFMVSVMIAGIIIAVFFGILITREITIPIRKGLEMLLEMSKGHLCTRLKMNRHDEIGTMASALDEFSDMLQNFAVTMGKVAEGDLSKDVKSIDDQDELGPALQKIIVALRGLIIEDGGAVLQAAAQKDLTRRLQRTYQGEYARMKENINTVIQSLGEALTQVSVSTDQVSSASQQISAGSQSLAQGANEQASSLEEISSSLEEMTSMTKQNAGNANLAKNLAGEANVNAKSGGESMKKMDEAIQKIKVSSDETSKIIKTIDEIAMQTNLLALNAAVEAARAGEAGRGFAVVAEEVRNLAQRSAEAAKNTADMIAESVKNADDGVKIAGEVSSVFMSIDTSVKKVNDLISEIAVASQEQSLGIEQINTSVAQMDKITQQNAANAEESASAAEQLSSQSEELQSMVAQFVLSQKTQDLESYTPAHHTVHQQAQAPVEHKNQKFSLNKAAQRKLLNVNPEEIIPMDVDGLQEF
jgi:methyl-accepting chemotaxis protein